MTDLRKEANTAYDDWAWNKKGDAVGHMLPYEAARVAFIAGAEWATLRASPPAQPDLVKLPSRDDIRNAIEWRPPECPFCSRDPYHYVDIGVGMEAVAVTCCELGVALFDRRERRETIELLWDEFTTIADTLSDKRQEIRNMEDFLVEHDLWDKFLERVSQTGARRDP